MNVVTQEKEDIWIKPNELAVMNEDFHITLI